MSLVKENYAKQLLPFLPEGTAGYVAELIFDSKTSFKISKKRKTKLGDYRAPSGHQGHRISVNGDLNPYAFLITTLHEFAHLRAFENFGYRIKPHGKEWQMEFVKLFEPVFEQDVLPDDVYMALQNYLRGAKASSCTDQALYRVLKRYDKTVGETILVEHLKIGDRFKLNGKYFERGKKLRKYYLCKNLTNNRQYRVLGIAEIEKQLIDEQ